MSTAEVVDPVVLTQRLIRFDTTNPPGDEEACVGYVKALLDSAGIETRVYAATARRPNLIARLPGRGIAPPLLLHAHVDVVPTTGQAWTHPPFNADIVDGHLWGRGAIDMKGGLATMLAALLRLRAEGVAPAGDVILAVLADEEAGSAVGARFLAQRHRELFDGVAYAIGEDGGAALGLGDQLRFHPIVVAEKRACWLRATFRGPGGHASRVAPPEAAMRSLTRLLTAVDGGGLGIEMTPTVDRMLAELVGVLPQPLAGHLAQFRADPHDESPLRHLPERDQRYLRSVLQHTVNVTVIRAGSKTNVLPSEISVELDGRLLPGGFGSAEFGAALRHLVGGDVEVGGDIELEVLVEGEPMPEPRLGPFYERLAAVLRERDPAGVPLPMMTTASTDARVFPQFGIATYGWMPLGLPAGTAYRDLLHSADERIPVSALAFGADCFFQLLRDFP